MRLELLTPAGDLLLPDTYNKLFSMHGTIMVWFFLVPAIPTTLGNFSVPVIIGAKDLASPRLNLLSWYLFVVAGSIELYAILTGGFDTGWMFYTLAVGYLLPFTCLLWPLRYGKPAGNHPWAAGLVWQTVSPPPTYNFDSTPVVTTEAYDYAHIQELPLAPRALELAGI